MRYCPFWPWREATPLDKYYLIDLKKADVNGDSVKDDVLLIGKKPFGEGSPFYDNITLGIRDGRTNQVYTVPLESNSGYSPTIFVGDFTEDGVEDILININSGGSGGLTFNYIYSFLNNIPRKLFDYNQFNEEYKYKVNYKDNYKVEVISEKVGKQYILDISYKDKEYLSEIYDDSGKLKESIEGDVIPLGGLFPIDVNGDGVYEAMAVRRISGRYNADGLGYVQAYLKWNGKTFEVFNELVAILGSDITLI